MSFRIHAAKFTPPPPSRCKSITYVSLLAACVLGILICGSATAQILPPPPTSGLRTWTTNSNGNGNWGTAGNWDGGIPNNDQNTHALFENHWEGTEAFVTNNSERKIGSLWFNAGTFYTLQGSGAIELKGSGNHLIFVRATAGTPQSEHNINNRINISGHNIGGSGGFIENYSEGGLRLGDRDEYFILGDRGIRIRGTGAIHIASNISGSQGLGSDANGNIRVNEGDFSETPALAGSQPHLILSGYQPDWSGGLRVLERGFVIVKRDQALGRGSERHIYVGGTIALRSHLETQLTYAQHQQNNFIEAEGLGIRRSEDTRQIGAVYNDGGYNIFGMRIALKTRNEHQTIGFGSRGDRGGGIEITNYLSGAGSFRQLGPGLIYLNNTTSQESTWQGNTELQAGVLRIGTWRSLAEKNLVFAGGIHGGILELAYGTSFNYSLGTGTSDVRWTGDGGFSAFGGARSVTISGGALTWGSTEHFFGDGYALLLSSRYANNIITLTSNISFGSDSTKLREVRVARGDRSASGVDAHAVLSGALSGDGGLVKTDDGLLRLTGSNTYTGATRIEGGALRGAVGNSASNIVLAGGVLGLDADFARGLGGSGSQIRWSGSGGFAAYGSTNHTVNIGGAGATLTWGSGGFVGNGQELRFGHYTADRTVLWDNALALGGGERTIRVENGKQAGAVVNFRQAISGTATLNLLGNGRIDLTASNSALTSSKINIYGAELHLLGSGKLGAVGGFDIRHGGALVLNNTSGTSEAARLKDTVNITLAAGTLRLDSAATAISEKIGDLTLEAGANAIELTHGSAKAELHAKELKRAASSRATLNISGDLNGSLLSFKLINKADDYGVGSGTKIIPWATNDDTWLIAHSDVITGPHFLKALVNYYTGDGNSWLVEHNVKRGGSSLGSNDRNVNSLILDGNLNLQGHKLTVNSGGLMFTGNRTISGGTGSTITTAVPGGEAIRRPLYIHNNGQLTIGGSVALTGGMDMVKTRGGNLVFGSSANHSIGSLTIHQGTVELRGSGNLQIGAGDHRIYIGDGAGEDRLILPGGRWNPITKADGGAPSITLRGTPYDPRGPEYGGDQAILQLGGNGGDDEKTYGAGTKQRLANLHIEGRGTIDWRGGEVGQANILWIDELTISDGGILFIRNWYEYEDLFLVKKIHNGKEFNDLLLNQIVFEGYQDYYPTLKNYDADYWQITPWGASPAPEPVTTGAILGAVGIGLVIWRRRRRATKDQ